MTVLVQEFGWTGRNINSSDGIILVNESIDDQPLIYWTKGCLSSETAAKKMEYEKCWKWLYGLQAGSCLQKSLLENFQSSDVFEQAASGECCSSCDICTSRDFNCRESAVLLLNALEEVRKLPITKGGVSKDKVISRLDFLMTFRNISIHRKVIPKGVRMNGWPIKNEWWSIHLSQLIRLGLVKLSFNVYTFGYFTRLYSVTDKGKTFLEKSHDLLVLNPEAFGHRKAKMLKPRGHVNLQTGTNITYLRSVNYYLTAKVGWNSNKEECMNILVSKTKKIMLITARILRKQWDLAHAKDPNLCGTTVNSQRGTSTQ